MFYLRLLLCLIVLAYDGKNPSKQYIFTNSARIHVLLLAALVNIYPFVGRDVVTKYLVIMLETKI